MKPILFSAPMVRAILDGRKTMTRRVIKPPKWSTGCYEDFEIDGSELQVICDDTGCFASIVPSRAVGDILWVRETWGSYAEDNPDSFNCEIFFRADYPDGAKTYEWNDRDEFGDKIICDLPKWRPSIFMPKEAARIFLRVTSVRAERVQDITEADALHEGVSRLYDYMTKEDFDEWAKNVGHNKTQSEENFTNYLWHGHFGRYGMGNKQSDDWEYQYSDYPDARGSFSSLWHMINAKRGYGWDKNPWVWVYEFERISKEEAKKLEVKA